MNPTKVTLILSSESAFGAVFSMIFGMESFKWSTVVGGALKAADRKCTPHRKPVATDAVRQLRPSRSDGYPQ